MRIVQLDKGIIYGPVNSRRLGRSLGVNLLSFHRKLCPFDCVYCQLRDVRRRAPDYSAMRRRLCRFACARCPNALTAHATSSRDSFMSTGDDILIAVENAIRQHAPLDNITFSGNGEPTIHPQFARIVAETRRLRDQLVPDAQLAVLSCAATLRSATVREALGLLDQAVVKLDVGDEDSFQRLNRPCPGVSFAEILAHLTELRPAVIQSMVVGGPAGNIAPAQREAWLDAVAQVGPREVQLYSLGRMPAEEHVEAIAGERLQEMAADVRQQLGIRVLVY